MAILVLLFSTLGYGLLYAASPGRQARGVSGSPMRLYAAGGIAYVVATGLSIIVWNAVVGPLVVVTTGLTAASAFVIAGPWMFAWAKPEPSKRKPSRPSSSSSNV